MFGFFNSVVERIFDQLFDKLSLLLLHQELRVVQLTLPVQLVFVVEGALKDVLEEVIERFSGIVQALLLHCAQVGADVGYALQVIRVGGLELSAHQA